MGYSNFKKIRQLKDRFQLNLLSVDLFDMWEIEEVQPSEWLVMSLQRAYMSPPTNEKSKSERLVSPVLLEILAAYSNEISFFSGEEININFQEDLAGPCDFFFALTPPSLVLEAPIISIAEAKDEDIEWGIAQCAAQLYAAHLFNVQEKKEIKTLYGCATTGTDWHFMKFENNTFYIDRKPKTDMAQILGTWHFIMAFFLNKTPESDTK